MSKQKSKPLPKVIVNRKATFDYTLLDKYVAGLVLQGTEIKSIRQGNARLADAYCYFKDNELWVQGMHISEYAPASTANHPPRRVRKLLLKRQELRKLHKQKQARGCTIVALRLFVSERGFAKLEIALAKGKKRYDKRAAIKERDLARGIAKEPM